MAPSPGGAAVPPRGEGLTSIHIQHAIRNERASIAWLVSRFSPLLLCQAQHRISPSLRRFCDPEDAVADTWMIVLATLPALKPADGSLSRGLLRFSSTVLIRRLRDLLEKHVINKPPTVSLGDAGEGDLALPAETRGVVSHVVGEERKGLVWAALAGLSEQDRQIVVLRGIEGRPYKEVAARVRLTPTNVGVRYQRILKSLREAVPDSVFEDFDDDDATE